MAYKLVQVATVSQSLFYFLDGHGSYMRSKDFDLVGVSSPGALLDEFSEREGVQTIALEMPRSISPLQDLKAIVRLWQVLRKLKPHIAHAHTPKGGLLCMLAAFFAQVPVRIYHVHGSPYFTAKGIQRLLLAATERVSCALANRVLVVSQSVRQEFLNHNFSSHQKSKVLGHGSINGVDAKCRFNPEQYSRQEVRTALNIEPDSLVIGYVGRFVRDKGIVELIEAFYLLKDRYPNLVLLLVGGFEQRDCLPIHTINTIQSEPRILYMGEVKDPAYLYAAMDIFTLPTYREGLPLVPLEAQSMKVPVVATKVMGCVDAIEDGITGILVPPRDPQALAQGLQAYLSSPELRNLHGANGRENMLKRFRPEDVRSALHEEYLALLTEKDLA